MKLKNIANDVRQLRVNGQIVLVQPNKIIEVESAKYDDNVFQVINTKKRNEKTEKPNREKEVNKHGTSK
jgi:hypothetical protein